MTQPSPLASAPPWDLVAEDYDAVLVSQFTPYAEDALRLAALPPRPHLLDTATGPGTLALHAARTREARVAAIDFAPAMLARLEARASREGIVGVEARLGDACQLPYPDAAFDGAFSMFGVIFFPDRARGLREMARVLRTGARAVGSSWVPPDRGHVLSVIFTTLAEVLPATPPPPPLPLGDPAEFRAELLAAGLREVDIHQVSHPVLAPSPAALWADIRRSMAPLVLLQKSLAGSGDWARADRAVGDALARALGDGPVRAAMPAYLGVGVK